MSEKSTDDSSIQSGSKPPATPLPKNPRLLKWFTGSQPPPIPETPEPYPEVTASLFSRLTYSWISPILKTGYLRTLEAEDLWTVENTPISANSLYEKFDSYMEKFRQKAQEKARQQGLSEYEIRNAPLPKYAVVRSLNSTFFFQFWSGGAAKVLSDTTQALTPLLTRHLITFTTEQTLHVAGISLGPGIGFAVGLALMYLVNTLCLNVFFYRSMLTGAQARAVLSHAIYIKSLKLSNKARLTHTNGKITNLLSTACHRVDFALGWFHFNWTFPVTIGISVALVVVNIGPSGLAGFGVLMIAMALIAISSRFMARGRVKVSKQTDARVSVMQEIFQNIKIIKFYSWETAYKDRVQKIRSKEIREIRNLLTLRNVLNALFVSVPAIAGLVSFVIMNAVGRSLDPARVFSSLTIYNLLRLPLMFLPLALITSIDAFLALLQIETFLSAPEADNYIEFEPISDLQDSAIKVTHGEFIWEKEEPDAEKDEDNKVATIEGVSEKENSEKILGDTVSVKSQALSLTKAITNEHSRDVENAALPLVESVVKQAQDSDENEQNLEKHKSLDPETALKESKTDESSTSEDSNFPGLLDLNLDVKRGELIIVTGSIGSGKSSLLAALAGSMRRVSGNVHISGNIVYCAQPWVQNTTLEKNITFGKPFDHDWYKTVIDCCSLRRDLEILPAGDQTEIGERGITLSGGQKARINLARAVYRKADVVLLDDVLSAVDAHVGKHMMDSCVTGVMANQTRILATHQLSMLGYADRIIFMDGSGKIEIGTQEQLMKTSAGFVSLMKYGGAKEEEEEEEEEEAIEEMGELGKKTKTVESIKAGTKGGDLMQAEDRAVNGVALEVWLTFVKYGGGFLSYGIIPAFLSVMLLAIFSTLFTSVWLSFWTSERYHQSEGFYIGIYAMLAVSSAILMFLFFFMLTYVVNRTALGLHRDALDRILRAPTSFFDTTPLGRILNRFTKDVDTVDNELSDQTRLFLLSTGNVTGVFILIIVYLPYFAIALAGLLLFFMAAASYYRASAREIKRLDSLGRSVVFSHFSESLNGAITIKSYGDEDRFIRKNEKAINRMNAAYFLTLVNQRWLSLRLDLVGAAIVFVVSMLCVTGQFDISPSSVGLVLSSMFQVINMLSLSVRELAQLENNMNAVERVYHYSKKTPVEAEYEIPGNKPDPSWPSNGEIEFDNVVMSYQPHLPPVLKNINLKIKAGEKIGICGRTGAGKSSIMTALYRLVELSHGSINIDGVDISTLGLYDLRSKLSIIPQDPVLFQGTVRTNIDPFGVCADVDLWDALRRSRLLENHDLQKLRDGQLDNEKVRFHLDKRVDDEGVNFSLGEKQLLSLARAVVRKSKILILDEATSSVDFKTDSQIQNTIVNEFGHCTILCIAHRLRTILNYDRILVMDAGEVVEFDTPKRLYQSKGSFYSMCEQSGIDEQDF